jgi:hypothetical protein
MQNSDYKRLGKVNGYSGTDQNLDKGKSFGVLHHREKSIVHNKTLSYPSYSSMCGSKNIIEEKPGMLRENAYSSVLIKPTIKKFL